MSALNREGDWFLLDQPNTTDRLEGFPFESLNEFFGLGVPNCTVDLA